MKKPASIIKKPSAIIYKKPSSSMKKVINKHTMKKPMGPPKRSKALMYRRPKVPRRKCAQYVRVDKPSSPVSKWCVSMESIKNLPNREFRRLLLKIGIIKRVHACPKCGSSIKPEYHNETYQGRCNKRSCRYRVCWTTSNPLFCTGHGSTSLKQQMGLMLAMVADLNIARVSLFSGVDRKNMQRQKELILDHIVSYVETKQESISYGDGKMWEDVEVDEASNTSNSPME